MQHVFLVGAKSLGAYGGYETFINKLTEYHQNNPNIKYTIFEISNVCIFIDMANKTKTIPESNSKMKYLGRIFCLQYLHFPPKNI